MCPIHFLSQWWQLNGFSQVRILSCTLRFQGLTEQNDFTSWLDSTSDWINNLNGIVYMHASEQQILIKMRTTKSLRNLRIFCPLLGTVHYWGLLLNKNGWEAGFCPLLGAFPLLGSALLGEYSVFFCWWWCCPQGALVGGTCFGESSHEMNKHETKSSVKDKALHLWYKPQCNFCLFFSSFLAHTY